MLAQRVGEGVGAVVAAYEVEVGGVGRIQRRVQDVASGRRDRAGREPAVAVGVVGRVDLHVGAGQVAVVPAGLLQRVDDRGVALQRHADPQAVVEDRRHERVLGAAAGLLLDDRGQRHRLPHAQAAPGGARAELVVEDRPELRHHRGSQIIDGRVARQGVGLGEQVSLQIRRVGIQVGDQRRPGRRRGERRRGPEPRLLHDGRHLRQRQPFGEGDRAQVHPAVRELRHRVEGRHRGVEEILARLQFAIPAAAPDREAEEPLLGHHAGRRQPVRDHRDRIARLDVDEHARRRDARVRRLDPGQRLLPGERRGSGAEQQQAGRHEQQPLLFQHGSTAARAPAAGPRPRSAAWSR